MNLRGIVGRVVYVLLAGIVTFLIVFVIGVILFHFDSNIGGKVEAFAPLIGLLVGLLYFFTRPAAPVL